MAEDFRLTKKDLYIDITFSGVHNKHLPNTMEWLWITTQVMRGYDTEFGNSLYLQVFPLYTLSSILSMYGKPAEVLVFGNRGPVDLFHLLIFYPDLGIAALFVAPLERSGDQFLGCMWKAYTHLYLWAPELNYQRWSEAVSVTTGGGEAEWLSAGYMPLEEATSISMEEFYKIFKESGNTNCLKTPQELWPGP
jgi:hypothetical protein